jgi:hypothetical protein
MAQPSFKSAGGLTKDSNAAKLFPSAGHTLAFQLHTSDIFDYMTG